MVKLDSILTYLIIGLIVFTSGSIASVFYSSIMYVAFFLLISVLLLVKRNIFYKVDMLAGAFFSIFVFFSLTIFSSLYGNTLEAYFNFFLRYFVVVILLLALPIQNSLENSLFHIFRVIVAFSLFSFIYSNVTDFLFLSIGGEEFPVDTIGFIINRASTVNFLGVQFYRSQGFFWEPSVLQIYLNLFLLLSFQKNERKWIFITFLAVLATFSLTGIIISTLITLYFFRKIKINFVFKLSFLLIVAIFSFYLLYMKIYVTGGVSYNARSLDFISAYRIISDNTFLGIGFGAEKYLSVMYGYVSDLIYMDETRGITNSVLYMFVCFGLPAGFFYLYILFKQTVFRNDKALVIFILLVSAFSSPLLFMNFYLMIFASFFILKNN